MLKCKCGNLIRTEEIPNPHEWLIISDVDYDKFSGKIDAEELYKEMKSVLICSNCNRLWVFWNGWQSNPTPYNEDTNEYE